MGRTITKILLILWIFSILAFSILVHISNQLNPPVSIGNFIGLTIFVGVAFFVGMFISIVFFNGNIYLLRVGTVLVSLKET